MEPYHLHKQKMKDLQLPITAQTWSNHNQTISKKQPDLMAKQQMLLWTSFWWLVWCAAVTLPVLHPLPQKHRKVLDRWVSWLSPCNSSAFRQSGSFVLVFFPEIGHRLNPHTLLVPGGFHKNLFFALVPWHVSDLSQQFHPSQGTCKEGTATTFQWPLPV